LIRILNSLSFIQYSFVLSHIPSSITKTLLSLCHHIYLRARGNCANEDLNPRRWSESCGSEDPRHEGKGREDDVDEDGDDGGALPVVVADAISLDDRGGGVDGGSEREGEGEEGEEGACAEEQDGGVTRRRLRGWRLRRSKWAWSRGWKLKSFLYINFFCSCCLYIDS